MSNIIKYPCPNCSNSVGAENLHSNVLYCEHCGKYSYYHNGMVNENVFFGLARSKASDFDGLKECLVTLFSKSDSKIRNKIKFLHIERFLLPVRMINKDGEQFVEPMVEIDASLSNENKDVQELLKRYLKDIGKLFSIKNVRTLRLDNIKEEVDKNGFVNRTILLPVTRSKQAIDQVYGIPPAEMLKILYVPVYRLEFSKGITAVCLGDNSLTGLDPAICGTELPAPGNDRQDALQKSFMIGTVFSLPLAAYLTIAEFSTNAFIMYPVFFIAAYIALSPLFAAFLNYFISISQSLGIMRYKQRLHKSRVRFTNLFDYKANCHDL